MRPDAEAAFERARQIERDYGPVDPNWPYEVYDEWNALLTAGAALEKRTIDRQLENFFHKPLEKDYGAFYLRSGDDIDPQKIVQTVDTSNTGAVDKMTVAKQLDALKFFYAQDMRDRVKADLQFDFSELNLPEQFNLFAFLNSKTRSEALGVAGALKNFGKAGYRTMLSLEEEGSDFGDLIVDFAENKVDQGTARAVFESYGQLLNEADELEALIREQLDCEQVDCATIVATARERLLNDAHRYLKSAIESGDTDIVAGLNERTVSTKKLAAALQGSLFSGALGSVEAFAGFASQTYSGAELISNPELLAQITEMYRENYRRTGKYDAAAIEVLVSGFEEALADLGTTVYVRSVNDTVLAFGARTNNSEAGTSYLRALNNNPDVKGTKQGVTIFDEMSEDALAEGLVATAEATPENFYFYSQRGWVATESEADDLGAERYMLKIEHNDSYEYISKRFTEAEIITRAEDESMLGADNVIIWQTENPNEQPPLTDADDHFVLTRSVEQRRDDRSSNYIYVLEPTQHTATTPQMQSAA